MKFKDIEIGSVVTMYVLVSDIRLRYTVNQTPYYGLTLSDGEDTADARIWNVDLKKDIEAGKIYKITGKANEYANKLQIIISEIEDTTTEEVNWRDFFRFAPLSRAELIDRFDEYIDRIENQVLSGLTKYLIGKYSGDFFDFPAGVTMHHNYYSGLAYHTYSMLRLADTFLINYPTLDKGLLYSGIMIHDIGKIEELSSPKQTEYTQEGNLLGHIVIGYKMLVEAGLVLGLTETEEFKALEHLLVSHHGYLEYGSPKEPLMAEAYALFLLDLVDSKMGAIEDEIAKTEGGKYTSPIPSLNKKMFYVNSFSKPKDDIE